MRMSIWTHRLQCIWKPLYLFCLFTVGFLLLIHTSSEAYIAKRYSVRQIVKESSNILFGTVSEVNTKRQTAKIKVEKYIKGKAEFNEIRIRLDVYKGEKDHRDEAMDLMKLGRPIIVFYLKAGRRIDSLAHINGTWFQTQTTRREDNWSWWLFTHIEVYLNRDKVSRRSSTVEFQKELNAMLGQNDTDTVDTNKETRGKQNITSGRDTVQLYFLRTDRYKKEYSIISSIDSTAGYRLDYNRTSNRDLPDLSDADILWIGFRSLSEGRYRLNRRQENRIKEFVKNGGIVIASGQDSDRERPCGSGWLPEPLKGVESSTRNDFQTTSRAGELFKEPNRIRSGQLSLDDSWRGWNEKYEILATTNDGKEIVVAKLKHGKGVYLVTNLHNQRDSQVSKNRRMLENLVHFAVRFLEESK